MSLFVAAMLPLLVVLGFWQLERAGFKRALEASWFESAGALAIGADALPDAPRDVFVRVRLSGHYDGERQFLLDNRTNRGVAGYHVVTPFVTSAGTFFVNRGWIAMGPRRDALPPAPAPDGHVTVTGQLWPETGDLILLGADPWTDSWPKRVQRLDFARMSALLGGAHAREIRLEPGQPGALAIDHARADFDPRRHVGYAMQWFGLATVLLVGYVYFGRRSAREQS
jgi:surfeit locus 1 family protein